MQPARPMLNHRVTERHMARVSNNALSPMRSSMLSGAGQLIMRKQLLDSPTDYRQQNVSQIVRNYDIPHSGEQNEHDFRHRYLSPEPVQKIRSYDKEMEWINIGFGMDPIFKRQKFQDKQEDRKSTNNSPKSDEYSSYLSQRVAPVVKKLKILPSTSRN